MLQQPIYRFRIWWICQMNDEVETQQSIYCNNKAEDTGRITIWCGMMYCCPSRCRFRSLDTYWEVLPRSFNIRIILVVLDLIVYLLVDLLTTVWTLGFFMWCGFFMNKLLGLSVGRRGPKRLEHGRCALRKCRSAGIIEHRSARLEDRCRLLSKKEMSGRPLAEVPFRLCFTMVGSCSNESVKGN